MSEPFTGTYDDLPTRAADRRVRWPIAGLGALCAGGVWIQALICLSVGLIVWELWKMIAATQGRGRRGAGRWRRRRCCPRAARSAA